MKVQRFPINASNVFELVFFFEQLKIEFLFPQLWLNAFEHANLYFSIIIKIESTHDLRVLNVNIDYWQMIRTFSMKCLCIRFFFETMLEMSETEKEW